MLFPRSLASVERAAARAQGQLNKVRPSDYTGEAGLMTRLHLARAGRLMRVAAQSPRIGADQQIAAEELWTSIAVGPQSILGVAALRGEISSDAVESAIDGVRQLRSDIRSTIAAPILGSSRDRIAVLRSRAELEAEVERRVQEELALISSTGQSSTFPAIGA